MGCKVNTEKTSSTPLTCNSEDVFYTKGRILTQEPVGGNFCTHRGKVLNPHIYPYQHTLLTRSSACVDRSAWPGLASRAESHTLGALVLKQPRERPHREPVLGRMWCSVLTSLGDLACSSSPSRRTHKGIHMFVRVALKPSWLFYGCSAPCLTNSGRLSAAFRNAGFVSVLPAEPLTWANTALSGTVRPLCVASLALL